MAAPSYSSPPSAASPSRPRTWLASLAERQAKLKELGLPGLPRQAAVDALLHALHHRPGEDERSSQGAPRGGLAEAMFPKLLTEVKRLETDDGKTIKFLWRLFDVRSIESVLMRYPGRITLCISSQCGCGMELPILRHRPSRVDPHHVPPPKFWIRSSRLTA